MAVMEGCAESRPCKGVLLRILLTVCLFDQRLVFCIERVPVDALVFRQDIVFFHGRKALFKIADVILCAVSRIQQTDRYGQKHQHSSGRARFPPQRLLFGEKAHAGGHNAEIQRQQRNLDGFRYDECAHRQQPQQLIFCILHAVCIVCEEIQRNAGGRTGCNRNDI